MYGVGGNIYVAGQIRVKGHYEGRIFMPEGYHQGDDITQDPALVALADKYFPYLAGQMWLGGDTGCWFGVQ